MSFLLAQILRALIRLEKKVDNLTGMVVSLSSKAEVPTWVHKVDELNQVCPLCQQRVDYQPVNMNVPENPGTTMEVLVRTCSCEPRATKQPITGDFK
jgi:hypothetical protein